MTDVEPPSSCAPSSLVLIGRDRRGRWIAREQHGRFGGLFVSRAEAVKYALFENGHDPDKVLEIPYAIELGLPETTPPRAAAVRHAA